MNKTAVIVEPRQHRALEFVLNNFDKNLSDEWSIIIMHGTMNEKFIDDILFRNSFKKKIIKIQLLIDNLSNNSYNKLLLSEDFYEKIPSETILIFQTDTMISEENKHLIDDFLQYDYVGAPWKWAREEAPHYGIGNGGLSLRKKSACIDCIRHSEDVYKGINEDIVFSNYIKNKPSFDKAMRFSIETTFSENSFGLHKAWCYPGFISKEEFEIIRSKFIRLDELISLQ
jgi:hypothetical protein